MTLREKKGRLCVHASLGAAPAPRYARLSELDRLLDRETRTAGLFYKNWLGSESISSLTLDLFCYREARTARLFYKNWLGSE